MDLFEYQGKQYFARYDIPVSPGDVAYTVDEAVAAAETSPQVSELIASLAEQAWLNE